MNLLALVVALTSPAAAQAGPSAATDDQRARTLFDNGRVLYEEGRYEEAIAAWEEAYRLSQRHTLLYNIANAYERIGRYEDALRALDGYRAFAPADERATLERRVANLERRIAEARANSAPSAPAASPARGSTVAFFVVGAAASATGGALAIAARSTTRDLEAQCATRDGGLLCTNDAAATVRKDTTLRIAADASFGVAALAAVGGTWMLLRNPGPDPKVTVAPVALDGGAGLAVAVAR